MTIEDAVRFKAKQRAEDLSNVESECTPTVETVLSRLDDYIQKHPQQFVSRNSIIEECCCHVKGYTTVCEKTTLKGGTKYVDCEACWNKPV